MLEKTSQRRESLAMEAEGVFSKAHEQRTRKSVSTVPDNSASSENSSFSTVADHTPRMELYDWWQDMFGVELDWEQIQSHENISASSLNSQLPHGNEVKPGEPQRSEDSQGIDLMAQVLRGDFADHSEGKMQKSEESEGINLIAQVLRGDYGDHSQGLDGETPRIDVSELSAVLIFVIQTYNSGR